MSLSEQEPEPEPRSKHASAWAPLGVWTLAHLAPSSALQLSGPRDHVPRALFHQTPRHSLAQKRSIALKSAEDKAQPVYSDIRWSPALVCPISSVLPSLGGQGPPSPHMAAVPPSRPPCCKEAALLFSFPGRTRQTVSFSNRGSFGGAVSSTLAQDGGPGAGPHLPASSSAALGSPSWQRPAPPAGRMGHCPLEGSASPGHVPCSRLPVHTLSTGTSPDGNCRTSPLPPGR